MDTCPEVLSTEKWVRVEHRGAVIASSKAPLLLRAHGQLPVYYFPEKDVRTEWLREAGKDAELAEQGEGPWPSPPETKRVLDVVHASGSVPGAAWQVTRPPRGLEALAGHLGFAWRAMDAWFEEDWPIRVHPHDPYHRIDVRPSSRHVRVAIEGETIAETTRPVLLFETGLPTRYYFPAVDVKRERLRAGKKTTHCAYKGTAPHQTVEVGGSTVENVAWHYPLTSPGLELVQNLIAFYQERIEEFYVDGRRARE